MKALILFALLLGTFAADGQAFFGAAHGQYGSATDRATSCAANPHQLDFMANPPHPMLNWEKRKDDGVGRSRSFERYDI